MKKLLAAIFLIAGLSGVASAQLTNVLPVSIKSSSGTFCYGMAISAVTPTQVIASTTPSHNSIYVENESSTQNLFCSQNPNVAISGALRGIKIAANGGGDNRWKSFLVGAHQAWYCLADAGSATAMVCLTN